MSNLFFFIGLPRSGKSTLAEKWVSEEPGRVIVRADDIRLALTGFRYNYLAEGFVHSIKHTMIRTLLLGGHTVLVDGTHTTKSSIRSLLQLDINAQPILVDTLPRICIDRAIITGQPDLEDVIMRMNGQLVSLLTEGLDNVMEKLRAEQREASKFERIV